MSEDDKKLDTEDDEAKARADAAADIARDGFEEIEEKDDFDEVEEEAGEDKVEEEEEEEDPLPRLQAELDDAKDRLLRAMAETENLRRRAVREREDAGKYAISGFARDMLSAVDNLRRALDSLSEENRADESFSSLVSGVEITERELLSAFERHGIRRIEPRGEKFDHNFHQAIFHVETEDQPAGTIVEVVQPGYVIADRLLRPAMVGVAKAARRGDDETETHIDTEA